MHPALVWMIVGFVLLIVEVVASTFFLMWIGAGALLTALLSAFVPIPWVQWLFFAVASLALLLATRPLARTMHARVSVHSNVDSLIGTEGIVTEAIDPNENTGRVRIRSEDWRARSPSFIPAKSRVIVYAVEGTTLMVSCDPNIEPEE